MKRQTDPAAFWARVNKNAENGCWEWTGAFKKCGYGWLTWQRTQWLAHRFAWNLTYGPIPKDDSYHGICVCHRCDNRKCVNPSHLFLGTQIDNIKDMVAKGRSIRRYGPDNPNYKHGERCCPVAL